MQRILLFIFLISGFAFSTVTAGTVSSQAVPSEMSHPMTKRQQRMMKKVDKLSNKIVKKLNKSGTADESELRRIVIIGFAGVALGIIGALLPIPILDWLVSLVGAIVVLYALYLFIMYLLDNVDL